MSKKPQDEFWICNECAQEREIPLDTAHRSKRTGKLITRWLTCPVCERTRECHKADKIEETPGVIRV